MKNHLKTIARFGIIIACCAYILFFFYQNAETIQVAFHMNIQWLIMILILQPVFYILQSWRYKMVIEKCSQVTLPFGPMLKIYILARFLNTLFSQTGNVYSGIRLKKDFNITYTKYISGHASMTWIDLVMNLAMAVILIILLQPQLMIGQFTAWKFLSILMIFFVIMPFGARLLLSKMRFKNRYLIWTHTKLAEVITTTTQTCKDPSFLAKTFGLGALLFIRTIIVFSIFFMSLGSEVNIPVLAVFYVLFKLSTFIVITPGNLAVQEVVWGFLSENMGIGMAQGVLVSTLTRVVGTAFILIFGFALGGANLIRHKKEYIKPTDISEIGN